MFVYSVYLTSMDNSRLATKYAVRLSTAPDLMSLEAIAQDTKKDIKLLAGWEEWLRCEYISNKELRILAPVNDLLKDNIDDED